MSHTFLLGRCLW